VFDGIDLRLGVSGLSRVIFRSGYAWSNIVWWQAMITAIPKGWFFESSVSWGDPGATGVILFEDWFLSKMRA